MPENDHQHPKRTLSEENEFVANPRAPFVELGLATCFSFLRGTSDAVDLVTTAYTLGYDAIGVADRNTLAGVVRVHAEAKVARMRPVIGSRLILATGEEFLAYPEGRAAYGRLSRLLSKGKMRDLKGEWQRKGVCDLSLDDLAGQAEGLQLILVPPEDLTGLPQRLRHLRRALPGMRHVAASHLYRGEDRQRINALDRMAARAGLAILATNDVLYHDPSRRPLQDVMTCIREKVLLAEAGFLLEPHAERHLKGPAEMARLFAEWPGAIRAAREVADACTFSLDELAYEYPREVIPQDATPQAHLERLTWEGAAARYPAGVPAEVTATLRKELAMIGKLDIACYFLTIHDIVLFARSKAILCQGRGSAANSAVCYVLGITAVDPAAHQLLFERFISEERKEPPDIDVDFEHERREEVIQHIYEKYGRDRAGLCATVIHYRPRSAIREVGKVLGLSEDVTGALARTVWGAWGTEVAERNVAEAGLDLSDPTLRKAVRLASQMVGMPRHLSQHVGGFILTERPLLETVPIGNGAMPDRSFIEWDKDDIDALGILKVDILALGMLTCIRKALDLVAAHHGLRHDLASVPQEDPRVYAMLSKGDSIGVFQVESRAQMNMLPRLRPKTFYDLVIEVAIVRPGPIQGDMVHPYLRRRAGSEAVEYPSPAPPHPPDELKQILGRTLGVPIFQEQAMRIAIEAAQFSPAEANELRKAMATFRSRGQIDRLQDKMVGRMVGRGYDPDFARRCFDQIKGFGEYGFPESHAASFALLVYVSSWLKCHFPAAFGAALLNSQPMGFYAPAQIVRDMANHGVEVRAPDVNLSDWDTTLVPDGRGGMAVRLGLRQIGGLAESVAARLLAARDEPFGSVPDLHRRAGLSVASVRRLAEADALRSLWLDRRQALWEAGALRDAPDLPLFQGTPDEGEEPAVPLPVMALPEQVVSDYQTLRLSLKAHPMAFLRRSLRTQGYLAARDLLGTRNYQKVKLAGLVLVRQRPGSAKGVCFVTLEDETGTANLVIWPKVLEEFRKTVMQARLLVIEGHVQREVEIIHVVAERLTDRTDALLRLAPEGFASVLSHADEVVRPVQGSARGSSHVHPRDARVIPGSRDFRQGACSARTAWHIPSMLEGAERGVQSTHPTVPVSTPPGPLRITFGIGGGGMTYCVGLKLNHGLVFMSDTRTNAGLDNISTYRKMFTWVDEGETVITLLTAGNLATTQAVVSLIDERNRAPSERHPAILQMHSMFQVAKYVGQILKEVIAQHAEEGERAENYFNATMIVGGQVKGSEPRLFLIYPEGNFIEAGEDTPFLQIGEFKYGRPILVRAFDPAMSFEAAVKLLLVSFDSTVKANLSVGLPLDLLIYDRDSFAKGLQRRIRSNDAYFQTISHGWGDALKQAFDSLPDLVL